MSNNPLAKNVYVRLQKKRSSSRVMKLGKKRSTSRTMLDVEIQTIDDQFGDKPMKSQII